MLDITSVSAVIAATSVVVGVMFAVLELRNAVKQRKTELLMNLYSHLGTEEFTNALEKVRARESKDYHEYTREYGLTELIQVSSVFEGLGFLMHRKLIDRDIASLFSPSESVSTWEKIRSMIEDARKQLGQRESGEYVPTYKWWEYFYNEVKKREQRPQQTQQ